MLQRPTVPSDAPHEDGDDAARLSPGNAEREALSRVNAHAVPPPGTAVEGREFRGPLYELWGALMRTDSLRTSLATSTAAQLRARLMLPSASDRTAWAGFDRSTVEVIAGDAEAERGTAWPELLASVFARYVRDGDRRQYEKALDERQERLTRAVVMAAATDASHESAGRWLAEAADGAILLCEQSTWSLPAHDDAHARRGFVLSDAESPYVDLWAGEIVAQLAVADHVLGERWDESWPGVRERIRYEAERRVFSPFEDRDDFWWLGYWRDVNNWNPWILSNVVLAAVLLIDDTERLAAILGRALESLDRYVATLPLDGAIDEGVAYWWNGAARMLECLDLVARITDGALDAADVPVIREVARFPMRMQLGADWYVNVADGWARSSGRQPWHVAFRWGTRLRDDAVVAWASGGRLPGAPVAFAGGGLLRLMHALADEGWRDAVPAEPPLPARTWLPSVQVLVARARAGSSDGLTLAAKGGTNDENHNHKDLGSFILAAGGRPLLIDIGKPTYTAQTFSPARYGIRAMQSGWHNAPSPHGFEQGAGPDFVAHVTGVRAATPTDPDAGVVAELELDLSHAYPLADAESWRRTFRLVSGHRVEVVDAWRLDGSPGNGRGSGVGEGAGFRQAQPTVVQAQPAAAQYLPAASAVHLIAAGDVDVRGDQVVVRADGQGIRITTAEGVVPEAEIWELDDSELIAVWGERLTRLTYSLPAPEGQLTTIIEELGA
jgi:hypothetical protein